MRILVANKFWYRRGGLERVMFDEIEWLEEAGHEVAHFSTAHPLNVDSAWSGYFAPYLELGPGSGLSAADKARAVARMFENRPAARQFSRLVDDFKPDVIHVHGIHRQLSPSILGVARRRAVPVVQTLHDCHHLCPADTLLRGGSEKCDPPRCGTYWYGPAISHRCVRGSASVSALLAAETAVARMRHSYERGVTRFVAPSRCLRDMMSRGGWNVPTDVIPNAVPLAECRVGAGEGFAVIGRLTWEKGVDIALQAARQSEVRLTVAGVGPAEDTLKTRFPEAEFTGMLGKDAVAELVRRSRAVVVPSLWFENAPMSVLEAMAAGVPVIGSMSGGIPEQITSGHDGLLVPVGDADALADAMQLLANDPDLAVRLGNEARRTLQLRFAHDVHLVSLLETYERARNQA